AMRRVFSLMTASIGGLVKRRSAGAGRPAENWACASPARGRAAECRAAAPPAISTDRLESWTNGDLVLGISLLVQVRETIRNSRFNIPVTHNVMQRNSQYASLPSVRSKDICA